MPIPPHHQRRVSTATPIMAIAEIDLTGEMRAQDPKPTRSRKRKAKAIADGLSSQSGASSSKAIIDLTGGDRDIGEDIQKTKGSRKEPKKKDVESEKRLKRYICSSFVQSGRLIATQASHSAPAVVFEHL